MGNTPPVALTQAEILDIVRRVTPSSYYRAMEEAVAQGSGWELHEAMAAIFERLSLAVVRTDTDYRIDTAPGGSYATVDVTVTRSHAAAGVTLDLGIGSVLYTETGVRFLVPQGQEQSWGAGVNAAKTFTVQGERRAYSNNVAAGAITLVGEVFPGGQDLDAEALTVANAAAATGGTPDILAALGANRGVYRMGGEDVEDYRERCRQLPDMICPGAIRRGLDGALLPYGYEYETDYVVHEGADIGIAADHGAADEPLDDIEYFTPAVTLGAFYVELPDVTDIMPGFSGFWADDGAADYDAADGYAYQAAGFYQALLLMLDGKRASGVGRYAVFKE